jgi:hypothetical protein
MWRDFKAALKSWWAWIGIAISAIAVFSFVLRIFRLGLSQFAHDVLAAYKTLFYPIAEIFDWIVPFDLSDAQKDLVILWLAVGGAMSRTFFREYLSRSRAVASQISVESQLRYINTRGTTLEGLLSMGPDQLMAERRALEIEQQQRARNSQAAKREAPIALAVALGVAIAWPIGLVLIVLRPYLLRQRAEGSGLEVSRIYRSRKPASVDEQGPDAAGSSALLGSILYANYSTETVCDLRVVLFFQILSVALVVAGLSLANAIGLA